MFLADGAEIVKEKAEEIVGVDVTHCFGCLISQFLCFQLELKQVATPGLASPSKSPAPVSPASDTKSNASGGSGSASNASSPVAGAKPASSGAAGANNAANGSAAAQKPGDNSAAEAKDTKPNTVPAASDTKVPAKSAAATVAATTTRPAVTQDFFPHSSMFTVMSAEPELGCSGGRFGRSWKPDADCPSQIAGTTAG